VPSICSVMAAASGSRPVAAMPQPGTVAGS
jgi:hypothetical protein